MYTAEEDLDFLHPEISLMLVRVVHYGATKSIIIINEVDTIQ